MTPTIDPTPLVRDIIHNNQYMTLATTNEDGTAWASPVVYVYDEAYNLYFISRYNTRHVQNIERTHRLAVAIFDSHQPGSGGMGVQIEAEAREVPLEEAPTITQLFLRRTWIYGKLDTVAWFTKVLRAGTYGIYRVTPRNFGMKNPSPKDQHQEDARIEVKL